MCGNAVRGLCALALACGLLVTGAVQAQDTGTLKGKVLLSADKKPPRSNIFNDIKTEPKCAEQYPKQQAGSEQIIARDMDPKQEKMFVLQNAIVYISSDLAGKTFPAPTIAAKIDQKGCMYSPHVLTMQVDQKLEVLNSDPLLHNINAQPAKNPAFNFGQPQKDMKNEVTFKKPEIFKVKCDVHKWMNAWVGVFPHPFHAVSNEKGEYEIKGLPAGDYEVTFWHEVYGEFKEKVSVKAGDNAKDYTFKADGSAGG